MNTKNHTQASEKPRTETIAFMATELWAGIIAGIGEENPMSEKWIQWAGRNYFSNHGTRLRENPDERIVLEWPDIPLGHDNEVIHQIWDAAKAAYAASVRAKGQMEGLRRMEQEIEDNRPRYRQGDIIPSDWRDAREIKSHWQKVYAWYKALK